MPVDNTTTHIGLKLPNKDNTLEYDVDRLGQALQQVDTAIFALQQAQANLYTEQGRIKESLRKIKINTLVGENLLIP